MFLFALLGVVVGAFLGDPLLYGVVGLLAGRVIELGRGMGALEHEVTRLRQALAADWERRNAAPGRGPEPAEGERKGKRPGSVRTPVAEPASVLVGKPAPVGEQGVQEGPAVSSVVKAAAAIQRRREDQGPPKVSPVRESAGERGAADQPAPAPLQTLADRFRDWLQSGNLFVRVGILLLFFGVGFLIKYAVEHEILVFTMEMRLAAVAAGGLFLLALGWFLRDRRREYALLLQGAAVGILYLDVYGAFELYHLISAGPAFSLLVLIGLLAAGLAVAQEAPPLAWFGFAGGFLAPVVASSGSDDHVVLFSYYALLNAAILAVAWFKSWRALNLLGFGFTYGLAGVWGVLRYDPSRFATTAPFLALFFLFFVAITVLYAIRQPPRFRGYIDATLLFGTPLLTFAYQVELVRNFEYGIAWSAVAMGAFYLVLALVVRRLGGEGLRLLGQAFLALGVVFLSVAIPFALAEDVTAGIWALEGAGMVWVGARQGRPGARAFGLLLQAGAAVSLVAGYPYPDSVAFLNGLYLGAGMIGIAGCLSAYWLDQEYADRQPWEYGAAPPLLLWGLVWWLGAGIHELSAHHPARELPALFLLYAVLTVVAAEGAASRWPWGLLHRVQTALPAAGIFALFASLGVLSHPAQSGGIWAWPLLFAAVYLVLFRVERRDEHPSLLWGHTAAGLVLAAVLEWELVWRLVEELGLREGWRIAAFALVPVVLLQLVTTLGGWPLARWRFAYGVVLGGVLATAISLWGIWSVDSPGGAAPLPWLPLLNPVDMMLALGLMALFQWWTRLRARFRVQLAWDQEQLVWIFLGSLAFLWINVVLLRAMHHWWGVPYEVVAMFRSVPVQMAVSVLWAVTGVSLLLVARRRASRGVWVAGAVILAAVVAKLFLVDLAARGTVERIVSFLAVGGLLVGIGWFSPLPPRALAERAPNATEGG